MYIKTLLLNEIVEKFIEEYNNLEKKLLGIRFRYL